MSTGGGKTNRMMLEQQKAATAQQNKIFEKMLAETPEQARWREKSANWDKWLGAKNYSVAPDKDILNFDLWSPSHVQKQRERMGDLEGIGAAGLGTGDKSIALEMSRERNANQAAEDAGASYEQAVGARNAYFEGNALPYSQLELGKLGNLLGNASGREQFYTDAFIKTRPQSLLPAIFGGALQAGSALLGNPAVMAAI